MSQEQKNQERSSPGAESPNMRPQQTGQSAQTPAEGDPDAPEPSLEPMGQSSDAPATG